MPLKPPVASNGAFEFSGDQLRQARNLCHAYGFERALEYMVALKREGVVEGNAAEAYGFHVELFGDESAQPLSSFFTRDIAEVPTAAPAGQRYQVTRLARIPDRIGYPVMTQRAISLLMDMSIFIKPYTRGQPLPNWDAARQLTNRIEWLRANGTEPEVSATVHELGAEFASAVKTITWGSGGFERTRAQTLLRELRVEHFRLTAQRPAAPPRRGISDRSTHL